MKVLMSIKPKFVKKILDGTKTFELRKKIFKKKIEKVIIYESFPIKKVIGEFIIDKIISDTPQNIYLNYKEHLGITENEYFEYFKNSDIAYAIKIKKIIKYDKELSLEDFNIIKAPQSYQYIK